MRPFVILLILTAPAFAGVGDPTLRTDHPHYAGEGAFQTAEDCVKFATRDIKGEQERAIAVYQWLLAHQFHLHSPQECFVPGVTPGSKQDDYEMVVYDAAKGRFSYGYGLCGTTHAWNEPYWRALGMNARRRAFPGHTNSEIEYGGSWHAFDTDMAGLLFRKDGVVAGYEDIIKDPSIVAPNKNGIPHYPFAWPGDFEGMKKGWNEIAKNPDGWFKMYNSGYEALPGIVNLRRGETFTRYFDRDHFGGPGKRRFWHVQKGGPFRDWTFVNNGTPKHEGAKSNSKGNASYGNAEFVYTPDFSDLETQTWLEATWGVTDVMQVVSGTNGLKRGDIGTGLKDSASVTFWHFSPYVICGDPEDDENPMTGKATGGLIVAGHAAGSVALSISTNAGQSWSEAIKLDGDFEKDVTELVKGRYGWWLRFDFKTGSVGDLKFTTVCQMNQAMYPRLKAGGSSVTYRAASRHVVPVVPDFGLSEKELERVEAKDLRSANVNYSPRSAKQRLAYTTTNNKAGQVVFTVQAPAGDGELAPELLEVAAAARFQVRVPPPAGCDFKMEVSTDSGMKWRPLAQASMPADNEYSSGWMYGRADVSRTRPRAALVRINLYAGGYTTGLIAAELYGIHRTPPPAACEITYGWKESGAAKRHVESIKAGVGERTFTVPTGATVVDDFVRISVP